MLGHWNRGFESRLRHGCLSSTFCGVLSCLGRGHCDGLITCPKESYQVSTSYCYRVVLYKASHATVTIHCSIVHPHASSNHSQIIHKSSLLRLQQRHLLVKQGGIWQEKTVILPTSFCFHTYSSLTCHKISWNGSDSFTSSPKEVVLWILITLNLKKWCSEIMVL
jgi:hypothetical protein